MKTQITIFKKLTLLILIACAKATFAQGNEAFDNALNKSEYIFTGKVVQATPYWVGEHSLIYTRNSIIVERCLKGNLTQGQRVDIITQGGQIDDVIQELTHSLQFGIGVDGMYFCNINKRYEINFTATPTNLILSSINDSEFGFIQFFNDKVNPFAFGFDQTFKTANDLISYLDKFDDLKPFMAQIANAENMQTETSAINVSSNTQAEADEYLRLLNLKISNAQNNNGISNLRAGNPIINFYIENSQITGFSPTNALEFDININTSSSGIYLDNAVMRLTYNTSVFGHNIFTDGLVTLTRGIVGSNTTVYQDPTAYQNTQDTLSIGVGTYYDATKNFGSRFLLSSTKQKLVHVKLAFKNPSNCSANANASFVNFPDLNAAQFFESYTSTAAAPYDGTAMIPYDANASNDLIHFPLCADPVITDFSTHIMNAGRGTTFHIDGYNLGNVNAGALMFRNCDDGGATYVQIDKADVTAWNNTSIDLIFPSSCDSGITTSTGFKLGKLGSGTFQIFNGASNSFTSGLSPIPLGVHYSIGTQRITPSAGVTNVKLPRNLINKNNTGGYKFNMSAAVKSNAKAVKLIISAMAKWRCATGINFQLDTIVTSELGILNDNFNTISFSDTISALGRTATFSTLCGKPYITNIDIVFKSPTSISWFLGAETANVPGGQYDFLQVVIHELGHAHNLNHVNETNEIMYYGTGSSALTLANRRIDIPSSTGALDGGNYVTSYSTGTTCALVNSPTMKFVSDCSYHGGWHDANGIDELALGESFTTYPNPFENNINIEFELTESANTKVSLLNMFGEEITTTEQKLLPEGIHKVLFNGNISSGIYVIRLLVNDHSYTKKVIKN